MLEQLEAAILQEVERWGFDFFAYVALPDSYLGWPALVKMAESNYKPYALTNEPTLCAELVANRLGVLGSNPTGELLCLNGNALDLQLMTSRGLACGWVLPAPIRHHWFTMSVIFKKKDRMISAEEQLWLQQLKWRFMPHYLEINPFKIGLMTDKQYQTALLVYKGKEDTPAADAMGISVSTFRGHLDKARAAFKGAVELEGKAECHNQYELIGRCFDYGLFDSGKYGR